MYISNEKKIYKERIREISAQCCPCKETDVVDCPLRTKWFGRHFDVIFGRRVGLSFHMVVTGARFRGGGNEPCGDPASRF